MKQLHLGPQLELPLDAVTQKLAWLGRTGSGKTYAASKLAEQMIEADAQVVILDAVGVWYGLRLDADGKSKGIEIPVFGGLHGDVPLEPTGGQLMANLVVDRGISVVIDVSQFETDAAKARFAHEWADRFFFRKKAAPSAVHLFIEECQEFVPQNPQKGEERMLHAFQRIEKLGRNFGIGVSLISQRPQEVNKKALNQTECLFVFQMTGTQERKAIEAWIADKDLDEDVSDLLPRLEVGQAHVWSPQWLKVSETVRIAKKRTFNASSTPTVGKQATTRQLAPIDLDRIRKDMAATIERSKAEDPRELRKTIADLKAQLAKAGAQKAAIPPAGKTRVVEQLVVKETHIRRLEELARRCDVAGERATKAAAQLSAEAKDIRAAIAAARETNASSREARAGGVPDGRIANAVGVGRPAVQSRPAPVVNRAARVREDGNGDGKISGPQQKILDAAAFLEGVGVRQPDVVQLALFAGLSATGGYWRANIGRLRTLGLIEGTSLTEAGRAVAREAEIQTVGQLHDHVLTNLLTAPQRAILRVLIHAYPHGLSKEELGNRASLEPAGGYWRANLGRLRSLGLVSKREPIQALPVLFLEGA